MKLLFQEGSILVALTWTEIVLIPKVGGECRRIGLVEVIWKVCTSTMINRLWSTIIMHNALHSFRQGRGA